MTELHAVLLDVDGTLIDSNDAHARAWAEVLEEFGHEAGFEEARPLIGMGGDKVLPALTGLAEESPEGQRILARRGEIFRERHLRELRPCPGARALVERMRAAGLELVVATSASQEDLQPLLEQAGVADLIEQTTNADDAEDSKPDPDIVAAVLRCTGRAAEHVLMLGDTPYDVEAAHRAGVGVVAVRCGGWGDADLEGAMAVYDDPAAILARWEESPFGRRTARR
ncbi:MAG: HAD family hydrolase [Gemmatimonadota bacterium]